MNMNWMYRLEHKFGRYAIPNLTAILVGLYIVGYILQSVDSYIWHIGIQAYLTLNPYAIVHGQVWRLVSWLLIPPNESNIFFIAIMLLFYFSIGRSLERAWGNFQYNIYMFSGIIFTMLASFITLAVGYIFEQDLIAAGMGESYFQYISYYFSTYYVNMSIFLAYAATFPNNQVLLMFIIPIKVKILGFIYAGFLAYEVFMQMYNLRSVSHLMYVPPLVVGASLLNFLLFFIFTRKYIRMNRTQRKAHRAYAKQAREFKRREQKPTFSKHRCAVCGRTEKDDPNLTFRFCSKCEGNMEYCQDHLYTHVHYIRPRE